MNDIIDNPKGKTWMIKHNTLSMIRSLFMGKVWKWNNYKVVIRETEDHNWVFGCLATKEDSKTGIKEEVILPLDFTINQFIQMMKDENILLERLG